MQPKFTVRTEPVYDLVSFELRGYFWVVTAPDGQQEIMKNFPFAIKMLDGWIEEYRMKIAGQHRINRMIASA